MSFWRTIIPSWKFFDQVGSKVELHYRSGSSKEALGPWQSPHPPSKTRNFLRLLINPEENLWLAKKALLERLASDLYEQPEPELLSLQSSLSYKLVQNWVEGELAPAGAIVFQFELRVENPQSPSKDRWASAIHEL